MRERALKEDEKSFALERSRVVDINLASQNTIKLNIGGTNFDTTRATVCSQPGSFLEGILSGRHAEIQKDDSGRIFVDRDSEMFRYILNFLRTPTVLPSPKDASTSETLCMEAEYYKIRFFNYPLVFAIGGNTGSEYLRLKQINLRKELFLFNKSYLHRNI
jgi:hypothetical protein